MNKLLCSVLGLILPMFCHADFVPMLYDGNGIPIGQPDMVDGSGVDGLVIRPDSIVVYVRFTIGELMPNGTNVYFDETGCGGNTYVTASPRVYDWIFPFHTDQTTPPLYLLEKDSIIRTVRLRSHTSYNFRPWCSDSFDMDMDVYPVTVIADPTEYGFVNTPSGKWGYTPPLKAKVITIPPTGEIISCDGFESCLSQLP